MLKLSYLDWFLQDTRPYDMVRFTIYLWLNNDCNLDGEIMNAYLFMVMVKGAQ